MGDPELRLFNPLYKFIDPMLGRTCALPVARPLFLTKTECAEEDCDELAEEIYSCENCSTIYCSDDHRLDDESEHNDRSSPFHEYHSRKMNIFSYTEDAFDSNLEELMYKALEFNTKEFLEQALWYCTLILNTSDNLDTCERFWKTTFPALQLRLGKYQECFGFVLQYGDQKDKSNSATRERILVHPFDWAIYDEIPPNIELPFSLMLIKIRLYYTLTLIENSPHFVGIHDGYYDVCNRIRSALAPDDATRILQLEPELITNGESRKIMMHQLKLQIARLYYVVHKGYSSFWHRLINQVERGQRPLKIIDSITSELCHAVTMYAVVWAETPLAMVMIRTLFDYQREKEEERRRALGEEDEI